MSKTKITNVAYERLNSFVERVERLREEKRAIASDERDVFAEAKSVGFDVPTMRWLLKEREVDVAERDERDRLRDTYAHALGMAVNLVEVEGLSLRQAEKRTGVSKSSIQRAMSVPKVSQPAPSHDPATGEITTAGLDTPPVGSSELSEGHSSAAPDSDATGNSAHEGEGNGHRNDRDGERRGSEELQPERQSGRGGHQGDDGASRVEDGADSGPQQRHGGTRGGGGNHQSTDSQHVVRLGGDEGSLAASRGVDAPSTPPLGAVAEAQPERVARQDDGLDIPPFLRRQRASA